MGLVGQSGRGKTTIGWSIIQFISPDFYAAVWNEFLTKELLGGALLWMGLGDLIMYRMVNFKI